MTRQGRIWLPVVCSLVCFGGVLADGFNSPVKVQAGETHEGDLSSLNGSVRIGDGATVRGETNSVNGSIDVGEDCRVGEVTSVNGSVEIGERTIVDGEVSTVNGRLSLDQGAEAEAVSTVNGGIELDGASVKGDATTVNGGIHLTDGAKIGGSIRILSRGDHSSRRGRPLEIELEGGSVVEGDVIVEDQQTEVVIHLRGGSRILGRVENAKVVED